MRALRPVLLLLLLLLATAQLAAAEALPAAVLVLDPAATSGSLSLGGQDHLLVQHGDVQVNSSSNNAVFCANSRLEVKDGAINLVGGAQVLGDGGLSPEAQTGASAVPDPFARTQWPQVTEIVSRQRLFIPDNSERTLAPGYYVGGLSASGKQLVLHLEPGLYVFTDGDLFINDARVDGRGVTILMSGSNPGKLLLAGASKVDLTAPREGPLKDLLLVSARKLQGNDTDIGFNGTSATLDGAVYAPAGRVGVYFRAQVKAGAVVSYRLTQNVSTLLEVTGVRPDPQ